MDPADGFAQPSLACAEQIWERAQNPASASKALFSIVIFCGAFDRERRLDGAQSREHVSLGREDSAEDSAHEHDVTLRRRVLDAQEIALLETHEPRFLIVASTFTG